MSKRRVVITGLGTINPIGNNVKDTWENLIIGKSGVHTIKRFELSDAYPVQIAAEVQNFDPSEHFDRKHIKKMDTYTQ